MQIKHAKLAVFILMMSALPVLFRMGFSDDQLNTTISAAPAGIPAVRHETNSDYVGAGSCSASNCHGGRNEGNNSTVGREYSIWMKNDPHSHAFMTLYSEASDKIAKSLGSVPAYESETCLACHTMSPTLDPSHQNVIREGVSCEGCHGPAKQWLEPHVQASWADWTKEQKEGVGFSEAGDLLVRAKMCVECHVGGPDRDVNHDLIAAGHPRLYFELAANLENMPRHWSREKDIAENTPALEGRIWAIGQVIAAKAAVELLEQRAKDSHAVWPEFAEYDCFACHHDLRPSQAKRSGEEKWSHNKLAWGTWHTSLLGLELEDDATLAKLRSQMDKPFQTLKIDQRDDIGKSASELKGQLDDLAQTVSVKAYSVRDWQRRLRRLTGPERQISGGSWDELTQRYLATVALRQAVTDMHKAQRSPVPFWVEDVGNVLDTIRTSLAAPTSPLSLNDEKWNTIMNSFKEINRSLPLEQDAADAR